MRGTFWFGIPSMSLFDFFCVVCLDIIIYREFYLVGWGRRQLFGWRFIHILEYWIGRQRQGMGFIQDLG